MRDVIDRATSNIKLINDDYNYVVDGKKLELLHSYLVQAYIATKNMAILSGYGMSSVDEGMDGVLGILEEVVEVPL